jgi:hypothetical protein
LLQEGLLEHQCYRSVDEKLLSGVKLLDYAQVAKVQIKRLKPVVRFIMELKSRALPKRLSEPASNVRGCSFRGHGVCFLSETARLYLGLRKFFGVLIHGRLRLTARSARI